MTLLRHPALRFHLRQGLKFAVSGVLGAVIEFTIITILVGHYDLSPFVVFVPSALIPAAAVFFFNKYVTFGGAEGKTAQQTRRFLLVYASTLVVNYCLASLFYFLGDRVFLGIAIAGFVLDDVHIAYIAKVLAIGIVAVINYVLSHTFIFKDAAVEDEVVGVF